jgi:hypothetical protein
MLTAYKGRDGHRNLPLGPISERKSDKQPSTLSRICYKLVAIDQIHLDHACQQANFILDANLLKTRNSHSL